MGAWDWRKRKFSNPILPAPCPIWKPSPNRIRETLPPCACSREPIADSAEGKTPNELKSRPERWEKSDQRNQLRLRLAALIYIPFTFPFYASFFTVIARLEI